MEWNEYTENFWDMETLAETTIDPRGAWIARYQNGGSPNGIPQFYKR